MWAGLLLVGAIAAAAYVTMSSIVETTEWAEHTHDVIEGLQGLRSALTEAESARRGHGLTGDETQLAGYSEAIGRMRGHVSAIRAMTADNDDQRRRVGELEPLLDGRVALLEAAIAKRRSAAYGGREEIEEAKAGSAATTRILSILSEMGAEERRLLGARAELTKENLVRTRVVQGAGLFVSVGLLAFAFGRLRREVDRRTASEKEARQGEERVAAAAERAREANAFLDSIVENIPHMIFVKDAAELRFVRFNRAGEELLGTKRGDLMGKNDFDFFPKDQAEFFQKKDRQVLAGTDVLDIPEEPIQTPRGERWLHTKKIPMSGEDGRARYLLGISEDISERKAMADELRRAHDDLEKRVEERTAELRAANQDLQREAADRRHAEAALRSSEEQLRQSQKMEAVGRLAGGIAHDFNNLLSVILSYSSLLSQNLAPEDPVRADLDEIRRAGERAKDLTRQLLAFSRQQVLAPKIVDLNDVIVSMDRMLRRLIGEDIEIRTAPAPRLGKVEVDPSQMEQVIMNLVVNARDAMPEGGTITLETANVDLDEGYAAEHPGVTPGRHVMLAVTDTGAGIDRATQERIFEPFFTTKEQGKGSGLGLSTVFGIVKQSGGHIWVYSEPAKGTAFKVYLPRAGDSAPERTRTSLPVGPSLRGHETILLVEDEDQVRVLARNILKRSGYQVIDAKNAGEALLLCERFSGTIHLLATDLVMPKMSGRELAERLATIRPDMKVLFMSGYTDDVVVRDGSLEEGVAFLQKPITPETLTRKVREVLDAG